ncbi:hypothetical protein A5715_02595 [Mycolicibacter heraklionensis]|nr:hypothetical protein A5715_02595 [Mycolicibacter heraklionensis]
MSSRREAAGVGEVHASFGRTNTALLNALLPFRADFISRMGWLPENQAGDVDRYDDLPTTIHLAIKEFGTTTIIAGLRLTPATSVEESLSWSMFAHNSKMVAAARRYQDAEGSYLLTALNEVGERGMLWDLTRLVNRLDGDPAQVVAAMMELFGVGHGIIRSRYQEADRVRVRWIFTATELIVASLRRLGVEVTILTDGHINDKDVMKSYFCMVDPERSVALVRSLTASRNFGVSHLDTGIKKSQLFTDLT